MRTSETVHGRIAALHDPILLIEDDWDGWACAVEAVEALEACLAGYRPVEAFSFDLPSRVRIRGPKTRVAATNIRQPAGWRGHSTWRWYIDDILMRTTDGPEAELDTRKVWPGDHTLRVEAEFIELEPAAGTMPLGEIVGADPKALQLLARAGCRTTTDLIEAGARPADRAAIAKATGIDEATILHLVHQSDLIRITGVAGQYAALLHAAGVSSTKQLAQRNPANLLGRLEAAAPGLVERRPSIDNVVDWVNEAKVLEQLVFSDDK